MQIFFARKEKTLLAHSTTQDRAIVALNKETISSLQKERKQQSAINRKIAISSNPVLNQHHSSNEQQQLSRLANFLFCWVNFCICFILGEYQKDHNKTKVTHLRFSFLLLLPNPVGSLNNYVLLLYIESKRLSECWKFSDSSERK